MPEWNASPRQPVFNSVPAVILVLAGLITVVQVSGAVSAPLRDLFVASFVLVDAPPGIALPAQPLGNQAPYLLHVFVHFGLLHFGMNMVVLLGAGGLVARQFGTSLRGVAGFLVFFFACALAGALAQQILPQADYATMGGASTAISGLIAAAGWVRGGYQGMLRLAVPWIGFNIILGVTGVLLPIPIGWAAHIGGTVAGAILFPVLIAVFGNRRL